MHKQQIDGSFSIPAATLERSLFSALLRAQLRNVKPKHRAAFLADITEALEALAIADHVSPIQGRRPPDTMEKAQDALRWWRWALPKFLRDAGT